MPALSLPTAGRISRCDERYPEFIDHVVFDASAGLSMVSGSFEEGERSDPHPEPRHPDLSSSLFWPLGISNVNDGEIV